MNATPPSPRVLRHTESAEESSTRSALARYGFLADPESRACRGRRIIALLRGSVAEDLSRKALLDIGCSAGLVTREIAAHVQWAIGIDIDREATEYANANHAIAGRLAFARASGEALPFLSESFDLVICNHVYEHVDDARALMSEIARVLKAGGACWFAAGHSFQLVEPHYRLPLLSMMPRVLASAILRATGRKGPYEIRFLAPWRIPSLFTGFGDAQLVSIEALRDPLRYELAEGAFDNSFVRAIVRAFARPLAWIAPTQLWILRKKGG